MDYRHQTPLSMELSGQEYWSGLLFSSPGDLVDSGIEPRTPTMHVDSLSAEHKGNARTSKAFYFIQESILLNIIDIQI